MSLSQIYFMTTEVLDIFKSPQQLSTKLYNPHIQKQTDNTTTMKKK